MPKSHCTTASWVEIEGTGNQGLESVSVVTDSLVQDKVARVFHVRLLDLLRYSSAEYVQEPPSFVFGAIEPIDVCEAAGLSEVIGVLEAVLFRVPVGEFGNILPGQSKGVLQLFFPFFPGQFLLLLLRLGKLSLLSVFLVLLVFWDF